MHSKFNKTKKNAFLGEERFVVEMKGLIVSVYLRKVKIHFKHCVNLLRFIPF